MTKTARGILTTITSLILVALFAMAPCEALGEEVGGPFSDSIGVPVSAIGESELQRQVGFGLAGGDRGLTSGDRIAVILWDEAKPRRPQPGVGLSVGPRAAGASISVNVGGRYSW